MQDIFKGWQVQIAVSRPHTTSKPTLHTTAEKILLDSAEKNAQICPYGSFVCFSFDSSHFKPLKTDLILCRVLLFFFF